MVPSEALEHIGRRLKALREQELRLSTRELVEALKSKGVTTTNATVTRYEGGREPSLEYVLGLAALLGSTVDYVLDAAAPRERKPTMQEEAFGQVEEIVDRVRERRRLEAMDAMQTAEDVDAATEPGTQRTRRGESE